ncbi:MAG: hypothetical protein ACI9A7_000130 [Cyclobacteriaceae bacterium]|jgi:hypothetical protein
MNTFFIAGTQRSGTTLLSEILGRHPGIHIGVDSVGFRMISCFKYYKDVLPYNLDYSWEEIQSWLISLDYKGRLAEILDYQNLGDYEDARSVVKNGIEELLEKNGKAVFGDKTPNIQYFTEDLLALIPDTKIIHIVRDGRSTALSHNLRAGIDIYLAAQEWVNGNIAGLYSESLIGKKQYLIIKYEDLLESPEVILKNVCAFIGLPFHDQLLEETLDKDASHYVKSGFDLSKIDSFKNELSARQIRKIEKLQGPLLKKFGYKTLYEVSNRKHKPMSQIRRLVLNQKDNIKLLFQSKRIGMESRKNVEVNISFSIRLKTFIFMLGSDFLPEKVFRYVFRHRWIKDYYMRKKNAR